MKISQAAQEYVDLKQAMGSRFHAESVVLKALSRALEDVLLADVTAEQVMTFIAGTGSVTRFWHRKLEALRGFYRFAIARGYTQSYPLPLPVCTCSTPTPAGLHAPDHTVQQRGPCSSNDRGSHDGVFRRSIAWLPDSLSTLRRASYPNSTQDSLPERGGELTHHFRHACYRSRSSLGSARARRRV
jgi:hypothetical protein